MNLLEYWFIEKTAATGKEISDSVNARAAQERARRAAAERHGGKVKQQARNVLSKVKGNSLYKKTNKAVSSGLASAGEYLAPAGEHIMRNKGRYGAGSGAAALLAAAAGGRKALKSRAAKRSAAAAAQAAGKRKMRGRIGGGIAAGAGLAGLIGLARRRKQERN